MVALFVWGEEHGNELVSSLADLTASLLEAHMMAVLDQGFVPGKCVKIHRVEKRSVRSKTADFGNSSSPRYARACHLLPVRHLPGARMHG